MSNGTKKLGKDFQGVPKFPSVTVIVNEKGINVGYKNANWEMAVSLLIDGLRVARVEETKPSRKKNLAGSSYRSWPGFPH